MASDRRDIHNSNVPALGRSCEARHRGMCGVLEPEQLVELARTTHKARHHPGTELIGDSTEIHSYANVMRGVVKLSKVLEDAASNWWASSSHRISLAGCLGRRAP